MFNNKEEAYYSILIFTLFTFFLVSIIIIAAALYYKRKRKHIEETQLIKSQFSQTLLQSQLEIQEQTLKTISQEIHDNIGQALSLAKLNLNTMSIENTEQLLQKINNSKELVSKAIVDLRDLSRSLDTDYVADMGLQKAIEYELELIDKSAVIETQMKVAGPLFRFDKQKELILFRIVQEILNNIIKHAQAKKINVVMNYREDKLEMLLKDDGNGFDMDPKNDDSNRSTGLGLRNMHNRAKLIGADFIINSRLTKGTEIKIILSKETNNHEG